jgi:hypothetical protein
MYSTTVYGKGVIMNIAVFSDVTQCGPIEIYRRFEGNLALMFSQEYASMKVPGKCSSYLSDYTRRILVHQ